MSQCHSQVARVGAGTAARIYKGGSEQVNAFCQLGECGEQQPDGKANSKCCEDRRPVNNGKGHGRAGDSDDGCDL